MTVQNSTGVGEVSKPSGGQEGEKMSNGGVESISLEEQRTLIKTQMQRQLVEKDVWYLVDARWFKQWREYVGDDFMSKASKGLPTSHPGPIDNTTLMDQFDSYKVKEHLLEEIDYFLIHEDGWNKLEVWYGISDGQQPIRRRVVEQGMSIKDLKVEVYLVDLKLCTFKDLETPVTKSFSKVRKLGDIVAEMKRIFNISEDEEVRVWNRFVSTTYELLTKWDTTLQDQSISSNQMLIIEQKNEDGQWPRQTRSRSISSSSSINLPSSPSHASNSVFNSPTSNVSQSPVVQSPPSDYRTRTRQLSISPGLCGLGNLGNTCFMNSSLQCLSNTPQLTKYFLGDNYKHEINYNNPLGMHGKIAEAYADLIHQMWNGSNSYLSPRQFKMQVGRFAPQFSGYQQQDGQELLAFLLDGLHEDLNRVKQKPYVELQDDKGRPDEVVAGEAWRNHVLRNDSIIVDFFHGQFKSTVECPDCDKRSITFDPFCYLTLPLPIKKERTICITYVPLDSMKRPVKMKLTVPKMGNVHDLIRAAAKQSGCEENKLVIADVFNSKFHKIFEARESLTHITERDAIYGYEIPISVTDIDTHELMILPVYLREIRQQSNNHYQSYQSAGLFGIPLLISIPRKAATYQDLYQIILRTMRRYVKTPDVSCEEEDLKLMQEEDANSNKDEEMSGSEDDEDEKKIKDDNKSEKEELTSSSSLSSVQLFKIKQINPNGHNDHQLKNDGKPLKLNMNIYLAADWFPRLKRKYYNETEAESVEDHGSMHSAPMVKKEIQLSDCLNLFLTKEKLGADDPWYCPSCKDHKQAYKKFDLWSLPKILVIHLKRFSYNRFWRDKLDALVNFPLKNLNLSDYVLHKHQQHSPVYDLIAVSNHFGGLGGGHYTAYAKNCYDGQWYNFDDSSVSEVDQNRIVSKAAYVLFYSRRDDPDQEMPNANDVISEANDVFSEDDME